MEKCLWNVQGELLTIRDWHLTMPINDLCFEEVSFWSRAMGVTHALLREENFITIAKKVGKLLVMDLHLKRDRWRGFFRFKVGLTISDGQLFSGFFLAIGNGKHSWVQVKYDRLANFCFHCGLFGHDRKTCSLVNPITITGLEDETTSLHGPWLQSDYVEVDCFKAHWAKLKRLSTTEKSTPNNTTITVGKGTCSDSIGVEQGDHYEVGIA